MPNFIIEKREVVLKINDFHVPFHDMAAIRTTCNFIKYIKPSMIIMDEPVDFYAISHFDKDPERLNDIVVEKEMAQDSVYSLLRDAAGPNCEINEVESNHSKRLRKYVLRNAPEFARVRSLDYPNFMELSKFNIKYYKDYEYKGVLFKHGSLIRKDSAATAKAEVLKEGFSGASGHTHRLGSFFMTLRGGKFCWLECGCMCKTTDIDYIDGTANWQQGFGMFVFKKKSHFFTPGVIPIINSTVYFDEKLFEGNKK